jgi:4-alpha-glucanotransferase
VSQAVTDGCTSGHAGFDGAGSRDGADPQAAFTPPARWPRHALASISTHDLPTARVSRGRTSGPHRTELLAGSAEDEQAQADDGARCCWTCSGGGFPKATTRPRHIVAAMHAALAEAVAAGRRVPHDVLGELDSPTCGTVDQYPTAAALPASRALGPIRASTDRAAPAPAAPLIDTSRPADGLSAALADVRRC